jgi:DNA polymerase zeta
MQRPARTQPQKRAAATLGLATGGPLMAADAALGHLLAPAGGTIDRYYLSRHCAVCEELAPAAEALCGRCRELPQAAMAALLARLARLQQQHVRLVRLCLHCGGGGGLNAEHGGVVCDSIDCGVYFERRKVLAESEALGALVDAGVALLAKAGW